MTILQSAVDRETILDTIDELVRGLQADGAEPRFVVVGREAYDHLRHAMAARYGRSPGTFESYQWLTIVLDPFRGSTVCVLPPPGELLDVVRLEER